MDFLLPIEHLVDLVETFYTDSLSKNTRCMSKDLIFFVIVSMAQMIENLGMASFLPWRIIKKCYFKSARATKFWPMALLYPKN